MPTYEYRCPDGHEFERFSKMSEAQASLPCPECGKMAERRLSGGAGLVFKGSGFYLTDYGKNAHRKPEPATGKSSGDSSPESKSAEAKGGENKSADTKASESKSEPKSPESKSVPSKSSDKSSSTKKSE